MLPLSLYIHIPWCIQKCPYCDFNSHKIPNVLPEDAYITALLSDLDTDLATYPATRPITSIFIGGGTPSLLSEKAYALLFDGLRKRLQFKSSIEITLEANPNSAETKRFKAYRALGINRLSIGVQSFNPTHLKALGRVHTSIDAKHAIKAARDAGFDNINLDLMHGLPEQSVQNGMDDLKTAISYTPEHLSWYQLTLEPNTVFYKKRPILPDEHTIEALEEAGLQYLKNHNYTRYEISAFSKPKREALHNLNYWQFGDYYGIGAGAHSKLSSKNFKTIIRMRKQRQPKDYLNPDKPFCVETTPLSTADCLFEFMLNTTRLSQEIPYQLFTAHTGHDKTLLLPKLELAAKKGLIHLTTNSFEVTPLGRRFTNDLQRLFLP